MTKIWNAPWALGELGLKIATNNYRLIQILVHNDI
jgi:hypothetical protein